MIGELAVRVPMVEEPERVVEALAVRLAGRAGLAESPLADHGRAIAGIAQDLRDRDVFGPQRHVPLGQPHVAADPRVAGVPARLQCRS